MQPYIPGESIQPVALDPELDDFLQRQIHDAATALVELRRYPSGASPELHINWQLRLAVLEQARELALAGDCSEVVSIIHAAIAELNEPRQLFESPLDTLEGDNRYFKLEDEIALGVELGRQADTEYHGWLQRRLQEMYEEQAMTARGQARSQAEQNQPQIDNLRQLVERITANA